MPPFKPSIGVCAQDADQVKLWRRHSKWNERADRKDFPRWITFYDDGTLISDRSLLVLMDVTGYNKFTGLAALREQNRSMEVEEQRRVSLGTVLKSAWPFILSPD